MIREKVLNGLLNTRASFVVEAITDITDQVSHEHTLDTA